MLTGGEHRTGHCHGLLVENDLNDEVTLQTCFTDGRAIAQQLAAEEQALNHRVDRAVFEQRQSLLDVAHFLVRLAVQSMLVAVRQAKLNRNLRCFIDRTRLLDEHRWCGGERVRRVVARSRVGFVFSTVLLQAAYDWVVMLVGLISRGGLGPMTGR